MTGQGLPTAGVAAECAGVGVAPELGEARDGVNDAVAVHLNQQVLAIGLHVDQIVAGERGELALELSGLSLCFERWHGV